MSEGDSSVHFPFDWSGTVSVEGACPWCSGRGGPWVLHPTRLCPRVRAVEYEATGMLRRVEFFPEASDGLLAAADNVIRVLDEYPPEVVDRPPSDREHGGYWRVGGAARIAWATAFTALRDARSRLG